MQNSSKEEIITKTENKDLSNPEQIKISNNTEINENGKKETKKNVEEEGLKEQKNIYATNNQYNQNNQNNKIGTEQRNLEEEGGIEKVGNEVPIETNTQQSPQYSENARTRQEETNQESKCGCECCTLILGSCISVCGFCFLYCRDFCCDICKTICPFVRKDD